MVTVGTATIGEKEIRTDWPHKTGLTAGTTKQEGRRPHLEAEEDLTDANDRVGL